MPFVDKEHRLNPDMSIPGDRCFIYYKYLVDAWNEEPRWTTADRLYHKLQFEDLASPDLSYEMKTAMQLAWQVFFVKYVMPYEDLKEKLNGTI